MISDHGSLMANQMFAHVQQAGTTASNTATAMPPEARAITREEQCIGGVSIGQVGLGQRVMMVEK